VRRSLRAGLALLVGAALARPVAAHAGSLSGEVGSTAVPSWLVVLTGGAVIAGSFLFTSLLTDHEAIAWVNGLGLRASPLAPDDARGAAERAAVLGGRAFGVAVLAAVVAVGFLGPGFATSNAAILWVWGGWWAGYTITVYAVGNSWPLLNPWRALTAPLPADGRVAVPDRAREWVPVGGLLALVYLEVVTPVAGNPRFLAVVVLAYTVATLVGASLVGTDAWFGKLDPITRAYDVYGRLAPVQRTDDGLSLRLPATPLTDGPMDGVGFVVALLWATTYDGLVTTPAWGSFADAVVRAGVPGPLLYLVVVAAGYAAFRWVYRVAAARGVARVDTYVTPAAFRRWFVPSLVPIAAGYHVAHYLGYFLSLLPGMAATAAAPLSVVAFDPLSMPGWYANLQLAFVVLGHVVAIYVAHAVSFDVFPGALRAVRSQYPYVVAMVFYTMTSIFIITQPFVAPPHTLA
jgi:hypothetical protein